MEKDDIFFYGIFKQREQTTKPGVQNAMKDPHWYAVQESDTRMLPGAASLCGQ